MEIKVAGIDFKMLEKLFDEVIGFVTGLAEVFA
ncbi:hypothetical protein BCC1697_003081 [Burkholderia gladioli]